MAVWPIRLTPKNYRGSDPGKLRRFHEELRLCGLIADWVNTQGEKQTVRWKMYTYADVASGTGISMENAKRLCHGIDGGGNGFCLIREGLPEPQI